MLNTLLVLAVAMGGEPRYDVCGCRIALYRDNRVQMADSAEQYAAVFIGVVERTDTTLVDVPATADHARILVRYHLRVARNWRAPDSTTVVLTFGEAPASSCKPRFRPLGEYLVFASRAPDGRYLTSSCRTAPVGEVSDVIAALDRRRWP